MGQTDQPFSGRTYFFFAPIFIPFFILGIPMLDTAFAIVRRAGRRGNPAKADKDHLHHRLMRLGHGQTRSVLILWVWTALLSALVLYPTYTKKGNAVIPIAVAALGIALYTLFAPSGRRGGADRNGHGGHLVEAAARLRAHRRRARIGRPTNGTRDQRFGASRALVRGRATELADCSGPGRDLRRVGTLSYIFRDFTRRSATKTATSRPASGD